jgi:hypothetical protein
MLFVRQAWAGFARLVVGLCPFPSFPLLTHLPKDPNQANAKAHCYQQQVKCPVRVAECGIVSSPPLDQANPGSDPTVVVTGQVGQVFLAGLVVDQVDDECPHDPTSLFDRG